MALANQMTDQEKDHAADKQEYQPKTGARCGCKRGVMRDNCPNCEGTGMVIDFAAIRARRQPVTA